MENKRIKRLNSLLQEVLTEVIRQDVKDPRIHPLFSITEVDISKDLQHAKVYVSVLGSSQERQNTVDALQSAAGFIAITASKKVVMRYFPLLTFKVDMAIEKQMRVDSLLKKIQDEKDARS